METNNSDFNPCPILSDLSILENHTTDFSRQENLTKKLLTACDISGGKNQPYIIEAQPKFALRLQCAVVYEGQAHIYLPKLRFSLVPWFRARQLHQAQAGIESSPVASNGFDAYLLTINEIP